MQHWGKILNFSYFDIYLFFMHENEIRWSIDDDLMMKKKKNEKTVSFITVLDGVGTIMKQNEEIGDLFVTPNQ